MPHPDLESYTTDAGVRVRVAIEALDPGTAIDAIVAALDNRRGALFASGFEFPGRYTRWDIGFIDPPLVLEARGLSFSLRALNRRGRVLLPLLARTIAALPEVDAMELTDASLTAEVFALCEPGNEEERSRKPSVFSVIRAITAFFGSPHDAHLGLYGAFGYDLAFQFEPIPLHHARDSAQRDLVLYLPDEIVVVDHQKEVAQRWSYEFDLGDASTFDIPREGRGVPYRPAIAVERDCDHAPGQFAGVVRQALAAFGRGDLFEATPGQTFFEPCAIAPSELFQRLRRRNPAPYGFFINLGNAEYLVGASPEMYVRVNGRRVETCPIAGTIARGADALGDAAQIRALLNSAKDEAELTMCTDVDRNDKSRICEPGSVRVIGRRQIEMYSRLIHTVDHVEGTLRPEFDALDAFLTHAWAVTVTGAPKTWAMRFLEEREQSPRAWYGGAVGIVGFDGNLNTGLTLRTVRILNGVAEIRAGATLLSDSIPEEEERESRLKASALIDAIRNADVVNACEVKRLGLYGSGKRILLIDHQDSFVHTLANYLRQTGAMVTTLRAGFASERYDELHPDLVVLSPGPGRPSDFDVAGTLSQCVARGIPVFGVCLGLQGIVEYWGGELGTLARPHHGKPSPIRVCGESELFRSLPIEFIAGRYHSLYALEDRLPPSLRVTARSDDGIIMAIEHATLPLAAVQFHPESIMSTGDEVGLKLLENVVRWCAN